MIRLEKNDTLKFHVHCDDKYYIYVKDEKIGSLGINLYNRANGNFPLIEWISFSKENRGKGYIKEVLNILAQQYESDIQFECNDDLLPLYCHIGANKIEYDSFRKMYLMQYSNDVKKEITRDEFFRLCRENNNLIDDVSIEYATFQNKGLGWVTLVSLEKYPSEEMFNELSQYSNVFFQKQVMKFEKIYKNNCVILFGVNLSCRKK